MKAALKATPALAEKRAALMAAGDLEYNGGDRAYSSSLIAIAFAQRRGRAGCEACKGWRTAITLPKPKLGLTCRFRKDGEGWLCQLPGLENRRDAERKLCLKGTDNL
jgi:GH24 family phage-related lysozyme (muramidase)